MRLQISFRWLTTDAHPRIAPQIGIRCVMLESHPNASVTAVVVFTGLIGRMCDYNFLWWSMPEQASSGVESADVVS